MRNPNDKVTLDIDAHHLCWRSASGVDIFEMELEFVC